MQNKDEKTLYAEKQTCFNENLVPNCPAYLTHNINLNANLANGALVREHSLAFDFIDEKHLLDDFIRLTLIGDIIELQTPPTTINVEIFPDFPSHYNSTFEVKSKQRHARKYGSITNDGKTIIPIDNCLPLGTQFQHSLCLLEKQIKYNTWR